MNTSVYCVEQVIRSFHSSSLSVENADSASVQKQTCVIAAGEKQTQNDILHILNFLLFRFFFLWQDK